MSDDVKPSWKESLWNVRAVEECRQKRKNTLPSMEVIGLTRNLPSTVFNRKPVKKWHDVEKVWNGKRRKADNFPPPASLHQPRTTGNQERPRAYEGSNWKVRVNIR